MSPQPDHPADPPSGIGQSVIGASSAIAAVSIWAGWLVVMRLGVTTRLSAPDLTALRFATAGLVLLPIVLRCGFAIDRLGWSGFAAVVFGGGAPVALVIGAALQFAPVAHAGALYQGTVPLAVACLAAIALRERVVTSRKAGLVLVVCGASMIGGLGLSSFGGRQSIGHLLFLLASLMTAYYTVAIRRSRIDGLHAAAIAAVVSLLIYLPIYLVFFENGFFRVPMSDLVFQALYQGVLTAAISLALYGRCDPLVGCVERSGLRCPWPHHGGTEGDSRTRRMAITHCLGRDPDNRDRGLPG
jgi:drug/metabolite transporter (DMT)-like permease